MINRYNYSYKRNSKKKYKIVLNTKYEIGALKKNEPILDKCFDRLT